MNTRKLLMLFGILSLTLLVGCPAQSQTTAVSATITDSDSIAWANGTFTVTFIPKAGAPGPYFFNGSQMTNAQKGPYTGSMNGSGAMSVNLPDNTFISPSGSQWQFVLCPNSSGGCSQITTPVSGSSLNLTTFFSANVVAPRFPALGVGSYGYADVEVSVIPAPGGTYFNVTSLCNRQWTGTGWVCSTSVPNPVSGFGTTNFIPKYTIGGSGVIGNSSVSDNGTTVSTPSLNNDLWVCSGPGQFSSMSACYAAASSGQTCHVCSGWSETFTANLAMTKNAVGFLFHGGAIITEGSFSITKASGVHHAFIIGPAVSPANGAGTKLVHFISTGNTAISWGDTSGDTFGGKLENFDIDCSGAGASSTCLSASRWLIAAMRGISVFGGSTSTTDSRVGILLSGLNNFLGDDDIDLLNAQGFHSNLRCVQCNNVYLKDVDVDNAQATGGICLDIQSSQGLQGNFNVECGPGLTGISVTKSAATPFLPQNINISAYLAGNGTDVSFDSNSSNNTVTQLNPATPVVSDSGTNNNVFNGSVLSHGQYVAPAFQIQSTVFASLGASANGTIKYCSDCTIANPCAGSGSGAIAKRLNGVWVCN